MAIEGNQVLGRGKWGLANENLRTRALRKMGDQEDVLIILRGKETE